MNIISEFVAELFSSAFLCVPSMALISLVQVQSRVFTAKCSEPQVGISIGNRSDFIKRKSEQSLQKGDSQKRCKWS